MGLSSFFSSVFWGVLFLLFFAQYGVYFLQHVVCAHFYKTQNLKRRYGAQWALVTGASSGESESCAGRGAAIQARRAPRAPLLAAPTN